MSWDLDFTGYGNEELVQLASDIFVASGVVEELGLEPTVVRNFVTVAAGHYLDVPYHNFNHAVHVLHATALMSGTARARALLSPLERLALLLAALCHDLGHDGRSNAFHTNSASELSRTYGGQSAVLEHHHAAIASALLLPPPCRKGGGDVLAALRSPEERAEVLRVVRSAILHTDMTRHFESVRRLADLAAAAGRLEDAADGRGPIVSGGAAHTSDAVGLAVAAGHPAAVTSSADADDPGGGSGGSTELGGATAQAPSRLLLEASDRLLLAQALLHAADIGNAVRPFHVNDAISRRVRAEFAALRAEEEALGLPASVPPPLPPLDPDQPQQGAAAAARAELRFLDTFVEPLWERLAGVLPELEPQLRRLRANQERFRRIAEEAAGR
ncbi:hypothetical protein GPECTOR_138g658 [Gonium pectorale]|uniref:PDEase domain-containing protein n=1 Tax=Gonium pectorale TaxID=33097 RepID=A0A150FY73_GONPE|nr:hypothetical protein GPECTOR_138g658 [Gonium pectorale]|eukprot:KXZ42527.1 hypothetical protein GPECTOR_138g658 [Gonium pectorale]